MPNIHNMNNPFTPSEPEPAEPFAPPSVTARAHAFQGTAFEQAMSTIAHAQNAFQEHVASVNKDRGHYTEAGYKAQIAKFADTEAFKAIDRHLDQVRTRRDQAQSAVNSIRRNLSPDGDTAGELRATRYWNRTKAVLDSIDGNGTLISKARNLIAQAQPQELGTLLQELDAYCTARGITDTSWIEQSAAQVAPDYGHAVKVLNKAKQAVIMAEHNAERVTHNVAVGSAVPVPLARPNRDGDYDPDR